MIKIHSENIVPLLLPLPKWTDDTKSESIEKGDLIYMMKREQITFVPCYTRAIVEETHTSLDKMERTLTVRYVGAELLIREETKDDAIIYFWQQEMEKLPSEDDVLWILQYGLPYLISGEREDFLDMYASSVQHLITTCVGIIYPVTKNTVMQLKWKDTNALHTIVKWIWKAQLGHTQL